MVIKKRDRGSEERVDRLGSEIVRASAANSAEVESAAASPFLYARLRSRIASESKRREAGENWFTMLSVIWRTVPAMALVAVFALVLFLSTESNSVATGGANYDTLLGERDADEQLVIADRQFASSDEVLATILNEDEQGGSR
jgi:hypothetical protein